MQNVFLSIVPSKREEKSHTLPTKPNIANDQHHFSSRSTFMTLFRYAVAGKEIIEAFDSKKCLLPFEPSTQRKKNKEKKALFYHYLDFLLH